MTEQQAAYETPKAGDNKPPSDFDMIADKIDTLYEEAKQWLDGEPVSSQGQADDLSNLKNMIRSAEKEADELRKAEVKPHDDAKKAVQERYNKLIGKTKAVTGKTVLAIDAINKALTPWLNKQAKEQAERERKAREEAEAKRREAEEAARKAREEADSLAAREARERAIEQAEEAEKAAKRVERDKPKTGGGIGRASHLRTDYTPSLIDPVTAMRYYWGVRQEELERVLMDFAKADVRAGKRDIPGFEISETPTVI